MAGRTLQIAYVGDAKSVLAAQKQIDAGHSRLQGGVQKTGSVFSQVFGAAIPLSAVAAGAAVFGLAKTVVNAASDETEAVNKANVVFGDASASVMRFAENSATSFGISKAEALSAASGFGAMAQSAGLSESASADMSVALVKLAGDMASFNNQDPSEMLEKLRSGLAGEAEPLRQFGVFISEARVQTEAYRAGIAQVGEELTDAQKIQARYNIIQQDTVKQAGDFGRTLGESLPNQLRVLKASFTDLAADLGQLLVPALLELVKVGGAVIDNIELLIAAGVGFVAWKFVPELLQLVALGMERVGLAAGANAVAGLGAFVSAMGPVAGVIGGAIIAGNILNDTFYGTDQSASQAATTIEGRLLAALRSGSITFDEYKAAVASANEQGGGLVEVSASAGIELASMQAKAAILEGQLHKNISAAEAYERVTRNLTDAQREQRLVMLALTDSFLGIVDSANQVNEAQRELNRLEQKGKEDTKAYEAAVLDALEAQIGLEEAVFSYATELVESGKRQKDVEGKVRDLGREFGIQKGVIEDIIGRLREYIGELNRVPSRVDTRVVTTYDAVGTPGRALQHGGIVTRPTVALIGEAGPEAVIPLGRGRGSPGVGPTVHVHIGTVVGPGGVAEVAEIIRRELQKTGTRNVTAGIA